jgi:DNA-binding MarR family transcriptional regulator
MKGTLLMTFAEKSEASPSSQATYSEVITRDPFFLVSSIHGRSVKALTQALGYLDLRPRHVVALGRIAANQGLSQQELVRGLSSDSSTVVALIDDFEKRGLAQRRRNPRDRRTYSVYLTPEGEEALASGAKTLSDVTDELLSCLQPDERVTLARLLKKVAGQE